MQRYLQDLRELSPGVRWFIATETMLGLGIGIFSLLLNLHLLGVGLSEAEIGSIASFGILVSGAASIPCALAARRWGRKRLLVGGLVLMAAGYALFGIGSGLFALYAAQLLQSAGLALLITTEIQLLYSYSSSRKEETQGFSLLFAVFTLFTGAGTLAGGLLPPLLGGESTPYQHSLLVAAGFVLLAALGRYVLLPREVPPAPVSPVSGGETPARRWRLPGRFVWTLCIWNLIIGTATALINPFLNVLVLDRMGWGDAPVSFLLTLHGVVLFAASFMMPPLLEKLGERKTYIVVFSSNLLLAVLLGAALPAAAFPVLLLLRGGAFLLLDNLILTHSMSALPEQDRDAFASLRMVLRSAGQSIAAYGTGVLLSIGLGGAPFLLAAALIAVSFVYYLRWIQPTWNVAGERAIPVEGEKKENDAG